MEISGSHLQGLVTVIVAGDEGSARLDRVLAVRRPELSRSRLKGLILAGQAAVARGPAACAPGPWGGPPRPRPPFPWPPRRYDHNRRAGGGRRRARWREYRARHRVRG